MGKVKILKASAGSGKTYRLAYEYIKGVILDPSLYRHTLAVTFTNKATEEMKRRIVSGLDLLTMGASPYLAELMDDTGLTREEICAKALTARTLILHDYSRFAVSTIDKFFQRVVRAFFKELNLDFDYTVEIDRERVLDGAVVRLMEQTATDPALNYAVNRLMEGRMDEGQSWDLAPSLRQIGHEVFREEFRPFERSPEEMLFLFRKLEEGINRREKELAGLALSVTGLWARYGLTATDFKWGASGFAGYVEKCAAGRIPDSCGKRFPQAAVGSADWAAKSSPAQKVIPALEEEMLPLLGQMLELAQGMEKERNTLDLIRDKLDRSLLLNQLNEQVRGVAAEGNLLMIHETAALIQRLVGGNDAPFIYEKIGSAYSRYMIDEFQDTSSRQWENFLPLLDNALSEYEGDAVMLIGDVKQSIYRWRGGDWKILGFEAEERYSDVLSDPVPMDVNWRSEKNIVDFNNALIRRVVEADTAELSGFLEQAPSKVKGLWQMPCRLYTDFEQRASPGRRINEPQGYIEVIPGLRDEALETMTGRVRDMLSRGYSLRDIVVLVRSNGEARRVADALLEAGHPIVSQEALLLSGSPVVSFVMSVYRLCLNTGDAIARAQYNHFLGRDPAKPLSSDENAFVTKILRLSLPESYEAIMARFRLGEREEAVSYLQALYQVIISHNKRHISDVTLLLQWWEEHSGKKTIYLPSEQDAITVMTVHKAKGLEFKCVIIPYCDWDLFPKTRGSGTTLWALADDPGFGELGRMPVPYRKSMENSFYATDYFEESVYAHVDKINLLYVALTRAERELYILYDPAMATNRRVSGLIHGSLERIEGLEKEEDGALYRYGFKTQAGTEGAAVGGERKMLFRDFPSHDPEQAIRVRWDTDRYFAEDSGEVTPRRYGVLMHRLFERIDDPSELDEELGRMVVSGEITAGEQQERIRRMAFRMMEDPVIAGWFEPGWEIRNEQEILTRSGMRRPDRVMTRDDRAVVVDYKFGRGRKPQYREQVAAYMSLLREMGYARVEGYLWYVEQEAVEQVVL